MNSLYTQNALDLWTSEPSFLIAGGLRPKPGAGPSDPAIDATTPAELVYFSIDLDNLDPLTKVESTFNYSGYFLVDSEIFEYDAMQFEYEPLDSNSTETVYISSEADWSTYRALSKTGSQYFKPTGRYRIKARGVFGTTPAAHYPTSAQTLSSWTQVSKDAWY